MLPEPNPQILYWFAMPFTTPVPWEAVAYYNGQEGRAALRRPPRRHRPLPARPLRKAVPLHAGAQSRPGTAASSPTARRPARCFPAASTSPGHRRRAHRPAYAGRRMPFLDRIEFYREREDIPRFNKFLQGYYDDGGIIKESFDAVVTRATGCRRRCRRAACASTRRWSRPSSTSASTWRTRCSGRRPASAAASCARP